MPVTTCGFFISYPVGFLLQFTINIPEKVLIFMCGFPSFTVIKLLLISVFNVLFCGHRIPANPVTLARKSSLKRAIAVYQKRSFLLNICFYNFVIILLGTILLTL